MIRTLVPFILVFHQLLAVAYGWQLCTIYGCSGFSSCGNSMREKLSLDQLQVAPENRLEGTLDFCFFIISDKTIEVPEEILREILEHLERRIGGTETVQQSEWFSSFSMYEFKRYCDAELKANAGLGRMFPWEIKESWIIPIAEPPVGFEEEIARVQKRIEEYK